MARIRTIKPELWQDERIGTLPMEAMTLFIGLISHADDAGRLRGNPSLIRAQVFPYNTTVDVEQSLRLLERRGRIVRYEVDGERFISIPKFVEHQRIDKPKPSAFPAPPADAVPIPDESKNVPGRIQDESQEEWKGMEGNGKEVEAPPPPEVRPVPLPKKPPDELADPHAFFAGVQHQRAARGLPVEKPPPLPAMGRWWSEALSELHGDPAPLVSAYRAFAKDPYWQDKKPPVPFRGFIAVWRNYAPVRKPL